MGGSNIRVVLGGRDDSKVRGGDRDVIFRGVYGRETRDLDDREVTPPSISRGITCTKGICITGVMLYAGVESAKSDYRTSGK